MTRVSIAGFLLPAPASAGAASTSRSRRVTNPLGVPGLRDAMIAARTKPLGSSPSSPGARCARACVLRLRRCARRRAPAAQVVLAVAAAVGAVAVADHRAVVRLAGGRPPASGSRSGARVHRVPGGGGYRDPAPPALRHRRRHQPGARLRRAHACCSAATYAGDRAAARHRARAAAPCRRRRRRRSRSRWRSGRCARGCRTPSTAASAARATTRVHRVAAFLEDVRAGQAAPEDVRAGAARGARRPAARAALPAAGGRALC